MDPRSSWLSPVVLTLCGLVACERKETPEAVATTQAPAQTAPAQPDPIEALDKMDLPSLGAVPIPKDRPQTDAKIKLGHQLFFDTRLSADGSLSCYSCHQNGQGTGGETALAIGAGGKTLSRHSPVLWNVAYLPALYWDGRADSLEAQAKAAWAGANMGVGEQNLDKKAAEIAKIEGYAKQFAEAFGDQGVTPDTIVQAIAAYERTLICDNTPYDLYASGKKGALTSTQKEGFALFMGKAGCAACHAPPHFTTATLGKGTYFNTGVGLMDRKPENIDPGRKKVTKNDADFAAFKPPTLRNVTKTAPYFHDGSATSLDSAVRFMAQGGYDNEHKTPLLQDRKLTDVEIDKLLAFLKALECPDALEQPMLP